MPVHAFRIAPLLMLATAAVALQAGQPPASLPTVQILPPGAQTIELTITGQLLDDRDRPIRYGRVGLMNPERTAWQPLTPVKPDGSFSFGARVLPGKYILVAATGAYKLAETPISILEGSKAAVLRLILKAAKVERDITAGATQLLGCAIANMPMIGKLNERIRSSIAATPAPRPPAVPTLSNPTREFFFVTNRRAANPGSSFYDDDVDVPVEVSVGTFSVRFSATPPYSPPSRYARPTDLIDQMRAQNPQPTKILVFVHGFNVSFTEAMIATARLARGVAFDGPVILYSWPGGDSVPRYGAGADQVHDAVKPLRDLLTDLRAAFPASHISIVGHSMGNVVLLDALDPPATVYDTLLMVAPDVPVTRFKNWALKASAASRAQRILYASSHDCALMASQDAHGSHQRAGDAYPDLTVVRGVETVDASPLAPADNLGHSLYLIRQVQLDMQAIIDRGLAPAARGLTPRKNRSGEQFWRFP